MNLSHVSTSQSNYISEEMKYGHCGHDMSRTSENPKSFFSYWDDFRFYSQHQSVSAVTRVLWVFHSVLDLSFGLW